MVRLSNNHKERNTYRLSNNHTRTIMVRLSNNYNDNNTFHLLANRKRVTPAISSETKDLNY